MHLHIPHISYTISSYHSQANNLPHLMEYKELVKCLEKAKKASCGEALGGMWAGGGVCVRSKVYKVVMLDAELLSTTSCTARA